MSTLAAIEPRTRAVTVQVRSRPDKVGRDVSSATNILGLAGLLAGQAGRAGNASQSVRGAVRRTHSTTRRASCVGVPLVVSTSNPAIGRGAGAS
jgi:hypothetical protein